MKQWDRDVRFAQWRETGAWQRISAVVSQDPDIEALMIALPDRPGAPTRRRSKTDSNSSAVCLPDMAIPTPAFFHHAWHALSSGCFA